MTAKLLNVNFSRLQQDVEALAEIGKQEDHGLYRMAFSDGDMQGRAWLAEQINAAGLDLYVDEAANVHGRLNWDADKPAVMTGSHIDTVPGAGSLDGALGVVVGLECLRCLKEQNIELALPVELIAFTDEEGRFGGLFGSQAIAGQLTPAQIQSARDLNGVKLTDIMQQRGFNAMDALRARRPPETMHAFVELHIEQGPVLDRKQTNIGVVDSIVGLVKWNIRLLGVSNHAGTTPMDMRRDAFQGLADFAVQLDRILDEYGSTRSVATIGHVELTPGTANVVPGKVEFSLEMRDTDKEVLNQLGDAFRRSLSAIARRRELMFEFEVLSEITPIKSDKGVVSTITKVTEDLDYSYLQMHSGAAHDTQIISTVTRAGMVFVPSVDGRSHSTAEWTAWEDIERGANVLLNTLYRLAT